MAREARQTTEGGRPLGSPPPLRSRRARSAPPPQAGEETSRLIRPLGRGIDHLPDLGDLGGGEAAHLGVLLDDVLVLRQIDAEGLVAGDVALLPLDVGAELLQDLVRLCRRAAQLFARECADGGDVAFDDEFAQSHGGLPE